MTGNELFKLLTPYSVESFEGYYRDGRGLDINYSDVFCQLIRDAARTNRFQSDVYYSLKQIDETTKDFSPEYIPDPIWIGFRKDGVDGTAYVEVSCDDNKLYRSLSSRYFMLYSVSFRIAETEYGERYYMDLNKYAV